MVSHLGVVDDPCGEREFGEVERRDLFGPYGLELFHDLGNARFQIMAEIPRIGTRIGDEFGLIEILGGGKGVSRRQAVLLVDLALQGSKIEELRRLFLVLFPGAAGNGKGLAVYLSSRAWAFSGRSKR